MDYKTSHNYLRDHSTSFLQVTAKKKKKKRLLMAMLNSSLWSVGLPEYLGCLFCWAS